MSDLVQRLRVLIALRRGAPMHDSSETEAVWLSEAADALEAKDAEIERVHAAYCHSQQQFLDATQEIERLRKDAERWQTVWACVRIAQHGDYVLMPDDPTGLAEDSIARAKFLREVDAAIDSAMQSAKE